MDVASGILTFLYQSLRLTLRVCCARVVEPRIPTLSVEVARGITIIAGSEVDKMTQAGKNLKLWVRLSTLSACLDGPRSRRCCQAMHMISDETSAMRTKLNNAGI